MSLRHLTFVAGALLALGLSSVSAPAGEAQQWDAYGATLSKGKTTRVSKVNGPTPEGRTLRLSGTVTEVCQAKGCWMNVADRGAALRVEFKDYGFFVPSTAAGKKVLMEGVVVERTLSEAEREHLQAESESGAPVPEHMMVFVASGVKILGGGPIPEAQQQRIGGRKAEPDAPAGD